MLDIVVPYEVAVVGVDDTGFICELSSPSLSSVMLDGDFVGYEAANLLTHLMNGGTQNQLLLLPPKGVAARRSTEVLASDDPVFANAIQFIRDHAYEGISIEDVIAHVCVARSTLNKCFRQHLGHSGPTELRLVRLNRVKQLLEETDLALPQIAEMAGYGHPEYFKRLTGQTPSQWRNSHAARRFNYLVSEGTDRENARSVFEVTDGWFKKE